MMIKTKKREAESDSSKPVKKFKSSVEDGKPKKLTRKTEDIPASKFQKKLTGKKDVTKPSAPGKPFTGEKKTFVENTPESKREYWNSLKAKQKEVRDQRRKAKAKGLYQLSVETKKIYETLKRKSTENKENLVADLHRLLNKDNTYAKIATSHDTARIIQCMIKNASEDLRLQIAEKLIPNINELATSKYGHHCITSLLKNGTKPLWVKIVDAIVPHVDKLVHQSFSGSIVDSVYNEYATNEQKTFMKQAFYSEIYRHSKDKNITCMKDTWNTNTYMKKTVLSTVKGHLVQAVNKKLVDNALLHVLLLDYLHEAGEVERTEIIELYLPQLAAICSTKDGTSAAIFCFLNSVVKERRAALKALKAYVEKLSMHEHGHRFILCVLNCYDDTVTLAKQVVSVILENVEKIVASGEWGRKVVGWIFSPADKDLLHPTQIEILDSYLKYSKKDKEIRRKEVLASAVDAFCKAVEKSSQFWLRGGHTALLTASIIKNLQGDHLSRVHEALARVVSDPLWEIHENEVNLEGLPMQEERKQPSDNKKGTKIKKFKKSPFAEDQEKQRSKQLEANPLCKGIEHAGLHIAVKKIIKLDSEKRKEDDNCSQFGKIVIENLSDESVQSWVQQNRSCFLLLLIFENSTTAVQKQVKHKLKPCKTVLRKQDHTGAKLLVEKLKL